MKLIKRFTHSIQIDSVTNKSILYRVIIEDNTNKSTFLVLEASQDGIRWYEIDEYSTEYYTLEDAEKGAKKHALNVQLEQDEIRYNVQ